MARLARDARIETREARTRLKQQHEPYWRQIHPGLFVGYRKGATGGVWFVRMLNDGKYTKKRLGVADDHRDADGDGVLDFRQAQRKACDYAENGGHVVIQQQVEASAYTVEQAMVDYMSYYKAERSPKPGTLKAAEAVCQARILPDLKERAVNALTPQTLLNWRNDLIDAKSLDDSDKEREAVRKRKSTANRVMTILKAALNYAYHVRADIHSDEPWRKLKPFKNVDVAKVRFLAADEATRLINACEPDFRALVNAALLTGCRYGELITMRAKDYHKKTAKVMARETKNGKPRTVPLSDDGKAFFDRLATGKLGDDHLFVRADGGPWGKSHQFRRMADACVIAKVTPRATFHNLRDTYASHLAMAGVPMKVIAELLGHTDTRVTEKHYAQLQDDYIAKTLRANLPSFGGEEKDNVVAL